MRGKLKTAALRSAPAKQLNVDTSAGIIRDVSIATVGEAKGHGFGLDKTSISQLATIVAAKGSVPCRLAHPIGDPVTSIIGTIDNARIVGDQVRGDLHLGDFAKSVPGLGDVRAYVLALAEESPTLIGLSAVITFTTDAGSDGVPVARITDVQAVDVVGEPAANRNGLLSAISQKGFLPMDASVKQYLIDNLGLSPDASDETAQAFHDSLSENAKAEADKAATAGATMSVPLDGVAIAERKRVASIRSLGESLGIDDGTQVASLAAGDDVMAARQRFLNHLAARSRDNSARLSAAGIGTIYVGDDRRTLGLTTAVEQTIQQRMGVRVAKPHDRVASLAGRTLSNVIEIWLDGHGIDSRGLTREKILRLATQPDRMGTIGQRVASLAQSTDSFPSLLANVTNKTLRQAYQEANRSWSVWARKGTLPDFKPGKRVALSGSPDLLTRPEGSEVNFSVLSDSGESIQLVEYSRGFRLTWQAIINDDLDGFGRALQMLAQAARRKEDDVAYTVLTANANMADGFALFDATHHANYTSSGAAIAIASLATGRTALRVQKGPASQLLNLIPRFLIVPAALESVANQYTSDAYQPTTASAVNDFASGGPTPLIPVVEPRLDANSAIKWYLAADSGQIDTVEVCFLEGEPEPVLRQETDFDTDDQKFAVRHVVGAKAIDYRGLYSNAGA